MSYNIEPVTNRGWSNDGSGVDSTWARVRAIRSNAGGGAAFAIARRRDEDTIPAAIIGGLSAVAGSYAGHAYRGWASTRIPPLAAALVEDLVALTIGAAVAKEVQA